MSRNIDKPYVIPAFGGNNDGLQINQPAIYFLITACSENVNLQGFDSEGNLIVDVQNFGAGLGRGPLPECTKWRVQTMSGNAGTISLALGLDLALYTALTVAGSFTLIGGSGLTDTADFVSAGGGIKENVLLANAARRTALVRSAGGNAVAGCRIGNDADVAANKGMLLLPGETYTVDSIAKISIFGATAADKFFLQEVLA